MLGLASNTAALRKVKVRSADRDVLAVRQRVERALAGVDWSPPGLAPGAILLVRRLVPATGEGISAPRSFGERVSLALREHASRARRPWLQADVLDAEAVVFVDEAELVACLVRDWLRGRVAERWWWKSVLANAIPQAWLRRAALERPEVLVPAISLLAPRDEAVAFVGRLDSQDCDRIFDAVAQSHAVARTVATAEWRGLETPAPAVVDVGIDDAPRNEIVRSAPLRRLMKEVPELRLVQSKPAHRRLLVLVLALIRAPTWARTAEFAGAIEVLERASVAELTRVATTPAHERSVRPLPRIDSDSPATSIMPQTDSLESVDAAETSITSASDVAPVRRAGEARQVLRDSGRDEAQAKEESATHEAIAGNDARFDETQPPDTSLEVEHSRAEEPVRERLHDIAPANPWPVAAASSADTAPRIETRFGGLFYLLNAALAMELYSDFTAPCGKNLALSPWDWLAIVGDAWLGRELRDDPAWNLLAELAGREPDEEPGRDFEPPHASWWAEHIAALRERITQAVGAVEGVDVPVFVCRHDGAIEVTATTLHVHLRLAALDLSIRIAGLDRDPGWIPAAGRSVRFHFD